MFERSPKGDVYSNSVWGDYVDPDKVAHEAAEVANFAMMIADNARRQDDIEDG